MPLNEMGIVFSDPQLAIDSGLDYFEQEEENIYICEVSYPSGIEYHLRKQPEVRTEKAVIKKYILTPRHKFRTLSNAMKAISYFRQQGKRYCVKRRREEKNGYKYVKYYYLCSM